MVSVRRLVAEPGNRRARSAICPARVSGSGNAICAGVSGRGNVVAGRLGAFAGSSGMKVGDDGAGTGGVFSSKAFAGTRRLHPSRNRLNEPGESALTFSQLAGGQGSIDAVLRVLLTAARSGFLLVADRVDCETDALVDGEKITEEIFRAVTQGGRSADAIRTLAWSWLHHGDHGPAQDCHRNPATGGSETRPRRK